MKSFKTVLVTQIESSLITHSQDGYAYVDSMTVRRLGTVLETTLVIDVVHDARWQHWKVEWMVARLVV